MNEKMAKFLLKNKKKIMIITVVIILVIMLIILSGAMYFLDLLDTSNANNSSNASSKNNMSGQVENKITNEIAAKNILYDESTGEYRFNVDITATIDELYEEFQKTTEGKRVLDYLKGTDDEKKALLKKMVKAQIITQYPDLRSVDKMGEPLTDDEVQGVIKLKRKLSEANVKKVKKIEKSKDTSIELTGGIVCWGDDFTLGNPNDESDSYPAKLAEELKKNVYNLGFENATSEEVALLAGASGYSFETTGEEFTIGAEINSEVEFSARIRRGEFLSTIPFRYYDGSSDDKKLKSTINGVSGELTYKGDGKYIFKRTSEGTDEVIVSTNTQIKIPTQSGYKNSFPVIWLGNGNSYMNYMNRSVIKNLIADCQALVDMAPEENSYIIIIPTHYDDSNGQKVKYDSLEYSRIREIFLQESGFKESQVLDLYDVVDTGNEYNDIFKAVKKCLEDNNINTKIEGEYTQDIDTSDVIKLSNDILPADENSEITLEYIPLGNKLEPRPGTLMWLVQHEDYEIQKSALQYFSIDDAGNIVVANWTRNETVISYYTDTTGTRTNFVLDTTPTTQTDVNMNVVRLNYKNTTAQYTMPFDYLWTLLVVGKDQEFVENIADLALNSKIEATLYDEVTTIENDKKEYHDIETEDFEYERNIQFWTAKGNVRTYTDADPSSTTTLIGSNVDSKLCTTFVVTKTNKIKYRVTLADVWCLKSEVVDVKRDYYTDPTDESLGVETGPTEWEESTLKEEKFMGTGYTDMAGNGSGKQWYEGEIRNTRTNKQKTDIIINGNGFTYSQGKTVVEEKTDKTCTDEEKRTKQFNDPNFVKYYLYSDSAKQNMSSVYDWLIEFLESNSNTEGMVDITKYMIYKATDKDLGITEFDIEAYTEGDFKELSYSDGEFVANGDFLEIAKQCHDYIRENKFFYSSAANKNAGAYVVDGKSTGNGTIPYPNGTNYIDCSAYVSWVLYEYGYTEFEGYQKSSAWFMGDGPSNMGWVVLPADEAKPGDILAKDGHVEIYVGNGTYGAGGTSSIRAEMSYVGCSLETIVSSGGFTRAIRITQLN